MAQSLKERYDAKRAARLPKKGIDMQLIAENATARLILEAMDEQDLAKAGQIIDKLRGMKGKGLAHLDAAIDKAESELNKFTGGGSLTKAWAKLKSKVGIDNPLVKVMTFANALETGFKQVPAILKNNLGELGDDAKEKTLNDIVTDVEKKKTLTNNLLKALSPKGIFGVFKKVPYTDTNQLVADLLTVPVKNLVAIVKQAASGPQSEQIAGDMKASVTGQGSAETKGTQPAAAATGTQPTAGTTPAKNTAKTNGATPTGETPPRPTNDLKVKVLNKIKPAMEDLGVKDVNKLVDALEDLGVLKSPA